MSPYTESTGRAAGILVFTGSHIVDSDNEAAIRFSNLSQGVVESIDTDLLTYRWFQDRRPRAMAFDPCLTEAP